MKKSILASGTRQVDLWHVSISPAHPPQLPQPERPQPPQPPQPEHSAARSKLPQTVVALGWVSLLTDAASDMIYPLLPAFLLSLGAGALAVGWLEGISELTSALLKLVSGRLSDVARRRKPLIALGYGISALARPLYAIAAAPLHAIIVRATDRVGKGLRGPPRDAMVASVTGAETRGHAFGFHRMMDNLGAVVGSLLAYGLLQFAHLPLTTIFTASLVPGLVAVLVILVFVRPPEDSREAVGADPKPSPLQRADPSSEDKPNPLSSATWRYLGTLAVFSLAASGDLFLIKRLTDLGLQEALIPVAWMSLQLGKGLMNVPGGRASDRFGRRRILSLSWVLYAATYALFGMVTSWAAAWVCFGLYAIYYGLAEGGQRALLAEYVPAAYRGRAYGYQLAIEGAMVLPANVLFGWAYDKWGAAVAFYAAAGIALVAAALLALVVPSPEQAGAAH